MSSTAMTANTSIQISESSRRKLSAKTNSSTGSGGSVRNSERKSAIDAALGKFVDDAFDDDIAKRPSLGRKAKDKDDLGVSEHSTRSRRRTSSGSKRASRTADTTKQASTRGRRAAKRDDDLGT
ncbi:MAG: hypothetical protein SGARI_006302, partial [Bacillariaceae sp.]